MTRPAPWKRSTAAERRAKRTSFQALKARVDASPAMKAYRERNRAGDLRSTVRGKVRKMTAGEGAAHLTPPHLSVLLAGEFDALKAASGARYAKLGPEQRQRLSRNLALLLMTLTDEDYQALADFEPAVALPAATGG